jgi:hypothetical protein
MLLMSLVRVLIFPSPVMEGRRLLHLTVVERLLVALSSFPALPAVRILLVAVMVVIMILLLLLLLLLLYVTLLLHLLLDALLEPRPRIHNLLSLLEIHNLLLLLVLLSVQQW